MWEPTGGVKGLYTFDFILWGRMDHKILSPKLKAGFLLQTKTFFNSQAATGLYAGAVNDKIKFTGSRSLGFFTLTTTYP